MTEPLQATELIEIIQKLSESHPGIRVLRGYEGQETDADPLKTSDITLAGVRRNESKEVSWKGAYEVFRHDDPRAEEIVILIGIPDGF